MKPERKAHEMKKEFSKKLLYVEYVVFAILLICMIIFPELDFVSIILAWIGVMGVSQAAYYWKAKNENRTKVPINVISSLPDDVREQIDLTAVMVAIIQSE